MSTLSVENLYELSADSVPGVVQSTFTNQLQLCPSVHATFFPSISGSWIGFGDQTWFDQVASALICSGISRSSLYGFSATVNGGSADSFWSSQLSGPTGLAVSQAITAWAFPAHCTDGNGTTFQSYATSSPAQWAAEFAAYLTAEPFINVTINKLIAADPNWLSKLNLAYYKLHLLDPSQEASVVAAWTAAYPKAIEQWSAYNYLTGMFAGDAWVAAANAAIGKGTDGSYCSTGGVGVPICSYWTDYGVDVISFLKGRPAQMGLATGTQPENQVDGSGGGGGCFVADSPLHLGDGSTIPIQAVGAEHRLLTRGGQSARHTDERVVVIPHQQIPIYGFNGEPPFFTAGHLFWTADRWKAFDPDVARYENPKRQIGKLDVGDVVYRLKPEAADDSNLYDEVRIESFTGEIRPAGEPVYGVHLEDGSTYHVHGYLVGMNYPQLTAQRLSDGFATLSPAERAQLGSALLPVLPLLRKAVGRFIEAPLTNALSQSPVSHDTISEAGRPPGQA